MPNKKGKKESGGEGSAATPISNRCTCSYCGKARPLAKLFGASAKTEGRDHKMCILCSHCHRGNPCTKCAAWTPEEWGKVEAARASSLFNFMHQGNPSTPLAVNVDAWPCLVKRPTPWAKGYRDNYLRAVENGSPLPGARPVPPPPASPCSTSSVGSDARGVAAGIDRGAVVHMYPVPAPSEEVVPGVPVSAGPPVEVPGRPVHESQVATEVPVCASSGPVPGQMPTQLVGPPAGIAPGDWMSMFQSQLLPVMQQSLTESIATVKSQLQEENRVEMGKLRELIASRSVPPLAARMTAPEGQTSLEVTEMEVDPQPPASEAGSMGSGLSVAHPARLGSRDPTSVEPCSPLEEQQAPSVASAAATDPTNEEAGDEVGIRFPPDWGDTIRFMSASTGIPVHEPVRLYEPVVHNLRDISL